MPEENGAKSNVPASPCLEGQTYFIPEESLGALENIVREMPLEAIKRARQVEFNRIEHILKDLRLIGRKKKIVALSFGCLDNGEVGMFVTVQPGITRIRAQIPENKV